MHAQRLYETVVMRVLVMRVLVMRVLVMRVGVAGMIGARPLQGLMWHVLVLGPVALVMHAQRLYEAVVMRVRVARPILIMMIEMMVVCEQRVNEVLVRVRALDLLAMPKR